ncbi:MAG: DUF3179 domain-containing protein [Chloroflexi bacterium]|nr:DUF3179 domain-containing protein [Chloroflexota bacterium]
MNTKRVFLATLLFLFVLVLIASCGPVTRTNRGITPTPAAPEPVVQPMPPPTPTSKAISRNEIGQISDEQLKKELREAGFSPQGWKTNFNIRSVPYSEFPNAIPKDAIPSIVNPKFESVQEANKWLSDREPVQVVNIKDEARAYPLQILMWHELVNDVVAREPVLITY